jgi:large subunit ribosomal protein L13
MEYTIDAKGKRLGRLASEVAVILQGKRDPSYDPKNPGLDRVVIKHYTAVTVSGRKDTQKLYHRHTGYMGHLKTLTFRQAFDRNPKAVIRDAVRRMMPKNFLNQKRLNRLIFTEE